MIVAIFLLPALAFAGIAVYERNEIGDAFARKRCITPDLKSSVEERRAVQECVEDDRPTETIALVLLSASIAAGGFAARRRTRTGR